MADHEVMDEETPDEPALDVPVAWHELSEDVKRRRWVANLAYDRAAAVLQNRIDGRLEAYGMVMDALDKAHRDIADHTNLDLAADSRQAAVWIVAGRCIGGTRAALALLAAGFGAESATQERAVHEATRLLSALADDGEPDILRRWLDDEDSDWVRPWQTREAQERLRGRVRDAMIAAKAAAEAAGDSEQVAAIEAGLELEGMREDARLTPQTRQVYDVLSRIGHSRRSGIRDGVSVELREMATGPHPDPQIRAEYVEYGGLVVEEVAMAVGDALGRFYGPGWYMQQVKPLIDGIGVLRATVPLSDAG